MVWRGAFTNPILRRKFGETVKLDPKMSRNQLAKPQNLRLLLPRRSLGNVSPGKCYLLILTLFLAISCLQPGIKTDPNKIIKRDMFLSVNGVSGEGVLVVPQADEYSFLIESRGELDLFVLSTCHRTISREEAGEDGIFGNKKKVKLKFKPIPGIEDSACPAVLQGFEVSPGRHSFGYVDFQSKKLQIPARVQCNGKESPSLGVSVCQGQAGTIQQIIFEKQMAAEAMPGCEVFSTENGQTFKVSLTRGICVYGFAEKENRKNQHRLTTLGFEKILIRKN